MLDNGPGFSDLMTQRAGTSVPYKPIDPSGNSCALRMTLEVLTSACLLEMNRISLQRRCMFLGEHYVTFGFQAALPARSRSIGVECFDGIDALRRACLCLDTIEQIADSLSFHCLDFCLMRSSSSLALSIRIFLSVTI